MFYLRTIAGGVETNMPIGETYTKVDLLKLKPVEPDSLRLVEEICTAEPFDLPCSSILIFREGDELKLKNYWTLVPGFATKYYIVDERGNTFDTLKPVDMVYVQAGQPDYDGPGNWNRLMKEWKKKLN